MITIILVFAVAICAVAGILIALSAKKRGDGSAERTGATGDVASTGRASGSGDN
jgi:hypothetical protein